MMESTQIKYLSLFLLIYQEPRRNFEDIPDCNMGDKMIQQQEHQSEFNSFSRIRNMSYYTPG